MRHILPLLLIATPAFAHPGAHMHPHGVEEWVAALILLTCAVGAGVFVYMRRSRK